MLFLEEPLLRMLWCLAYLGLGTSCCPYNLDDDDETGKQQKNPADGGGRHVMVSAAVWMDWEEEEERVDGVLTP